MTANVHHADHAEEHAHPGPGTYAVIAVILAAITAVEVAVYYIPALLPVLVPMLIVLSTVKFALVVMYYMHLKFDHGLYTAFFLTGLFIAMSTIVALMALYGSFGGGEAAAVAADAAGAAAGGGGSGH